MPASQSELPQRRMLDSYREALIPLGSNTKLREKYINFWNGVRFGRIMEDLDTMAGRCGTGIHFTKGKSPKNSIQDFGHSKWVCYPSLLHSQYMYVLLTVNPYNADSRMYQDD